MLNQDAVTPSARDLLLARETRARDRFSSPGLPEVASAGARPVGLPHANSFHTPELAPLIALVGCDGAGKSTLSADLRETLSEHYRVETCYLGLGSGEIGERIKRWPLVGAAVERKLAKKATQTRSKDQRIPGLLTALVVFGFSLLRQRRFRKVLALRRQGVAVVTDRYPQIEIPGFYDGPGLSAARAGGPIVAWLAARERAMYVEMASYLPTVVLRLNIDAATAYARKPDHKLDLLRRKIEATPLLSFGGAPIVEIDATASYADVRAQALGRARAAISPASQSFAVAA